MKAKFNIKPIYVATIIICFMVVVVGIVATRSVNNNNNQNALVIQQIMQDNNNATQNKLDGLASGQKTLNENDKIIGAKLDEQNEKILVLTDMLNLTNADILLLKEDVSLLGLKLEDNQEALLIQLQGLESALVEVRKQQGYANTTAKQLVDYNRCVSSGRSNCSSILD